jgi:hypothetical protein
MIKIITEAKNIPDGYTVTKATGTYKHTLCRDGLKVYMGSDGGCEVLLEGLCILQTDRSLSAIPPETPLAIHFDDIRSAVKFLDNLEESLEVHK